MESCKRQCVRPGQTFASEPIELSSHEQVTGGRSLVKQLSGGPFSNGPLEVPVYLMSGAICCTVMLDSIEMRVSEMKHMIEVRCGIPRVDQDIYLEGCPAIMQDERRLCHYAEALYCSSPKLCLVRRSPLTSHIDRSTWKRLKKELQNSQSSDVLADVSCSLALLGEDFEANPLRWTASISGPVNSPYACGTFNLDISLPYDYPYKPPLVLFTTPIFHPLVSPTGSVDLDLFHESWVPIITLEQIILRIRQELESPYGTQVCSSNHEAALLSCDKDAFDRRAREETFAHAVMLPPTGNPPACDFNAVPGGTQLA